METMRLESARCARRHFRALRDRGTIPRLHPNGFIQLDLRDGLRLHAWPGAPLPLPISCLPIRDQAYGFRSTVRCGALRNIVYATAPDPDGDYLLWQVRHWTAQRRTSLPLLGDDARYLLKVVSDETYGPGRTYRMQPFVFHATEVVGKAWAVVEIDAHDSRRSARIAAPIGQVPDADDRREAPPELEAHLWDLIEGCL